MWRQEQVRAVRFTHVRGPPVVGEVHRRQRGLAPGAGRVAGRRPQVQPLRLVGAGDVVHELLGPVGPAGDPVDRRVHRRDRADVRYVPGRTGSRCAARRPAARSWSASRSSRPAAAAAALDPVQVGEGERGPGEAVEPVKLAAGQVEEAPQLALVPVGRQAGARRGGTPGIVAPVQSRQQRVDLAGEVVRRGGHRADLVVRVRVVHRGRAVEREQRVVVHRLARKAGVGHAGDAGTVGHHHAVVRAGRVRAGTAYHPHAGCLRRRRVGPGQVDPVAVAVRDGSNADQPHGHTPAWLMTTTRMPFA